MSSILDLGVLHTPLAGLPSPLNIGIFGTYWYLPSACYLFSEVKAEHGCFKHVPGADSPWLFYSSNCCCCTRLRTTRQEGLQEPRGERKEIRVPETEVDS